MKYRLSPHFLLRPYFSILAGYREERIKYPMCIEFSADFTSIKSIKEFCSDQPENMCCWLGGSLLVEGAGMNDSAAAPNNPKRVKAVC